MVYVCKYGVQWQVLSLIYVLQHILSFFLIFILLIQNNSAILYCNIEFHNMEFETKNKSYYLLLKITLIVIKNLIMKKQKSQNRKFMLMLLFSFILVAVSAQDINVTGKY
jgi:hypothetical protein